MKLTRLILITIVSCSLLMNAGCGTLRSRTSTPTPTEEWQVGMPREGQPDFPALGKTWIIDNGCNFDPEKVKIADALFEKLRQDDIAEVAVICQTGIVDKGGTNDEKIWLRDWARWAKMGSVEDSRSVVWLIRPDVKPEQQRVTVELSRWLYWYTAIEYADTLKEASDYANVDDFNGALVAIARNTNEELRLLWEKHKPEPTATVGK